MTTPTQPETRPHQDASAYQGPTWRPRTLSSRDEIRQHAYWSARSSDSEYRTLREVLLAPPDPNLPAPADPDAVQHVAPVDFTLLHRQMLDLAECYRGLGVDVQLLDPPDPAAPCDCCQPDPPPYNLMFARDLFFMTPQGAVISRMASTVRAGEERHAARKLAELHTPILRTIGGTATLEGADVLWAAPDLALVGTGNRTDAAGLRQATATLAELGVRTVEIRLPRAVQHLLGLVQIVDRDLAVIRGDLACAQTKDLLRGAGLDLAEIPQSPEVAYRQAMNFVTVAPRTIVMAAGNPGTRTALSAAGLHIAAEADISELLKAAGGIGCATAVLRRDTADPAEPRRP